MRIFPVLLSVAGACALAACDTGSDAPPQGQAKHKGEDSLLISSDGAKAQLTYAHAGTPAPDAVFTGPDGKAARLADFRGKPLLVNLWATWCGPCKAEMPTLERLSAREAGKITVLALSQDMDGMAAVKPYFAKQGFKALQPYIDSENGVMAATASASLPTTIYYDAAGNEAWRVIGSVEWDDGEIADMLKEGMMPQ